MRTFGAVRIVVRAAVIYLCHRHIEQPLRFVDLLRYLRQVGYLERSTVLFDEVHQRDIVEIELVILDGELVCRKFERLFDQVHVLCLHSVSI